ncbi:Eco57I restriction-modification methylase domain-containing protein [Finegoldia magna]|uniref:Eco57I restriction-modification methylase domain-containing protein n=1 Tax=Finegoldia magna TaxID=1260 RepID=UPI000B91B24C|nr:N-6 DNA methylase [Finegoldia magna]OXZ40162.1 hypothetical protein B9N50_00995 [Finegoldia magna]
MNDKSKQTIEKIFGVYYTPDKITKFLSEWAISDNNPISILEPSAGDGRFVKDLHNLSPSSQITAIEIDGDACKKIKSDKNISVINDDFYNFYEKVKDSNRYDLVIGNPPYIRYQYLTSSQRDYQSNILKRSGLRANKLINAWVAFTVAGLELVKDGGKFAFVMPTDIFQVTYAKQLRSLIFDKLDVVNVITFDEIVFNKTQQDIVLVFGKKKPNKIAVGRYRSIKINGLDDLENIDIENEEIFTYTSGKDKWTELKLDKDLRKLYHGKFLEKTELFNNYAKVEVGITTGRNEYFAVNEDVIKAYDLRKYAIPLLGRSVEASGLLYKDIDLENNIKKGKNVWLLDFNNKRLNDGALSYIKYGEDNNLNLGYKLSLRDKWYEVPSIWNPDAFILRRMGEFPKIVKNQINGTSTDTFHRLRIVENQDIYKVLVLFYSSVTMLSIELESRVFGGGALEILPGDFKNIRIPKINNLDINYKNLALEIDKLLRNKVPIEKVVKFVDRQIESSVTFTKEELDLINKSWIKLKNNRIGK